MSITLKQDYNKGLRMAKPTVLGKTTVKPPRGSLGAISNIPSQIIPPLNTNIQFSILPQFKLSAHPGLAAIDKTKIPEEFNWRENGGKKRKLISTPGNQMLCGSCWAISAAGIVADNHVVSGNVDWKPDLSTTWCLACYPQLQCQGGNPAKLYQDISEHGIATNTVMSDITLSLFLLKPKKTVLINKHIYGCTFKFFQWYCSNYNLKLIVEDLTKKNIVDLPKADFVFFETPTNPFLFSIDIKKISNYFKKKNKNCLIVVDNTWATPLFQNPCKLGADISLHSATKYLSGHSDVMGGIVLTNNEIICNKLRNIRFLTGTILDPNSAWLLRRSLHTLEVRLEKQSDTTKKIVKFLKGRIEVKKVYYPEVDGKQLTEYATLVFLEVNKKITAQYKSFCKHLKYFSTGTGMACVTSMIAQPFTGSHASMEDDEKRDMGLDHSLIRLSFGMENADDLIADLKNAFDKVK